MIRLLIYGILLITGAVLTGGGEFSSHLGGWPLFIGAVLLGFLWQFGRRGSGTMSPVAESVGGLGTMATWVLVFVLIGWEGGAASILGGFGGGFIGSSAMGLIRGSVEI